MRPAIVHNMLSWFFIFLELADINLGCIATITRPKDISNYNCYVGNFPVSFYAWPFIKKKKNDRFWSELSCKFILHYQKVEWLFWKLSFKCIKSIFIPHKKIKIRVTKGEWDRHGRVLLPKFTLSLLLIFVYKDQFSFFSYL